MLEFIKLLVVSEVLRDSNQAAAPVCGTIRVFEDLRPRLVFAKNNSGPGLLN